MRSAIASMIFLVAACGGGGDDDDDSGGIDAPPAACTACTAGQGCLAITVTRTADVSTQPWTVWPAEADGMGNLIVSAREGTTVRARMAVANVNMVPASASYRVDLGCVPASALTLGAFLDDNLNAAAGDTFSSDYRDSCMMDRQPMRTIQAGVNNDIDVALNNSCD